MSNLIELTGIFSTQNEIVMVNAADVLGYVVTSTDFFLLTKHTGHTGVWTMYDFPAGYANQTELDALKTQLRDALAAAGNPLVEQVQQSIYNNISEAVPTVSNIAYGRDQSGSASLLLKISLPGNPATGTASNEDVPQFGFNGTVAELKTLMEDYANRFEVININNSGDGTIDVDANGANATVTVDNTGTGAVTITGDSDAIHNNGAGDIAVTSADFAVVHSSGDGAVTVTNGDDATVNNSGTGAVTVNNA